MILAHRFRYHAPDAARRRVHEDVRGHIGITAELLDDLLPAGREKSLAITKLEEAMFWANAAVARQED